MMRRFGTALSAIALLSACGGGGSGGSPTPSPTSGTPTPPAPTPSPTAGCSLRERQNWAGGQINEFYLFPETLPADRTPTQDSVQGYIDYLTATARAQGRDRGFTFITSAAQEDAFLQAGASAGFGIRLIYDSAQRRLFVSEAFEGAPALAAGLDRGTEILAIGTSADNLRTVDSIFAAEGDRGVSSALGPSTAGTARLLRIKDASSTRDVTVTKAEFKLDPVSDRYGGKIIDDGGKRVGYVNLRTFIEPANNDLKAVFASFRSQGVTEVIVDFRYNGGGFVSTAELMGDLLGGNRSTSDVLSYTVFRPEKSANNSTRFFRPQPESIAPMKIAFIGTRASASASELVINAFIPYLRSNAALIGTNTFGKPVGQIGVNRKDCDDRLRVVAFATQNAARQGDYYAGLAPKMEATCQAPDDISRQLGDPLEGSTRQALDFLAGRSCTPISTSSAAGAQSARLPARRELLVPDRPSTVQREVPGAF